MTKLKLLAVFLMLSALAAFAADLEVLRPKTDKVAIVIFEDLECPMCAHDHPIVMAASKQYNVPVIVHDFPLPQHAWSFEAAIAARYFESKSPELGHEFRSFVFQNQPSLANDAAKYRALAQRFAAEHHVELPFAIDPNGELKAKIDQDKALGQRVGIEHTPTIYIASSIPTQPVQEVVNDGQLFQMVEAAKRATAAAEPPKAAASSTKKGSTAKKSASAKKSPGAAK